jgi:hypothetical protein
MFGGTLEVPMSILLAKCPQCRIEVDTGISADDCTMRQLGPRLQVLVLCDDCRAYQKMMVRDLYSADSPNAVPA